MVKVTANVDSRFQPALKVVQSEPLDDHATYDQLFDGLIDQLKNGHKLVDFVKHAEVVEKGVNRVGESRFAVKTVLDAQKIGSPVDVHTRREVRYSKSAGIIYDEDRHPTTHTLNSVSLTTVLKDPLQVEIWRQFVNKQDRRFGEGVVKFAKALFDKAVGRDVTFHMGQPSPTTVGQSSVISESLENDTTMDKLWSTLMELCKDQSWNPFSKGPPEVEEDVVTEDAQCYTLWCDFDVEKLKAGKLAPADAKESKPRMTLRASTKLHSLSLQINSQDMFLAHVDTVILHPGPLRAEVYRFYPTGPLAGEKLRDTVSAFLETTLKQLKEKPPSSSQEKEG